MIMVSSNQSAASECETTSNALACIPSPLYLLKASFGSCNSIDLRLSSSHSILQAHLSSNWIAQFKHSREEPTEGPERTLVLTQAVTALRSPALSHLCCRSANEEAMHRERERRRAQRKEGEPARGEAALLSSICSLGGAVGAGVGDESSVSEGEGEGVVVVVVSEEGGNTAKGGASSGDTTWPDSPLPVEGSGTTPRGGASTGLTTAGL
mmetsp:Transcript_4388/g.8859  ORF Transcript_4388/g.8859 Transcript_4388/m.8859 type:complete len:210 (+) Transcript_4388:746-1375(+)